MGQIFSLFRRKRCRSPDFEQSDESIFVDAHETPQTENKFAHYECVSETEKASKEEFLGFNFLEDESTVNYIRSSKVLFVLRGLPGSGKSTLAKAIEKRFKDTGTVTCSADDYFMTSGTYEFDFKHLKEAHQECQEKAEAACASGVSPVVIDNTNVKRWEMKPYLQLGKNYKYVTILVEPNTAWKFDCTELIQKSKHGVQIETIERRLEQWEIIIPLYYGWFLNEANSKALNRESERVLRSCLELPAFYEDFKLFSQTESVEDCLSYYLKDKLYNQGNTLHCTAMFCKRGDVPGSSDYAMNQKVIDSLGSCFPINVIGFVMTPQTFGARVKLVEDELLLWGNEVVYGGDSLNSNANGHPNTVNQGAVTQGNDFSPTIGFGSRAHITLGCAHEVMPVTTGKDLLDIIECESESSEYTTFTMSHGKLRSYGEGRWVLYANSSTTYNAIFSGFY